MKNLNLIQVFATLLPLTTAHFSVTTQTTLGLSNDKEDTAPCGGFSFSSSSTTSEFSVGGYAVGVKTSHPQANILIRGTLDTSASGNWTNLFPIVAQYGLGNFCEPSVTAPAEWVGKTGLLQVIESSVDGLLYQCAAVKFVAGVGVLNTQTCTNGTGVTGSFTSDDKLPTDGQSAAASGTAASSSAPSSSAPSSTAASGTAVSSTAAAVTSAAPAATSSKAAGNAVRADAVVMGLASVFAVALLV